jgi:hypothetical protein
LQRATVRGNVKDVAYIKMLLFRQFIILNIHL